MAARAGAASPVARGPPAGYDGSMQPTGAARVREERPRADPRGWALSLRDVTREHDFEPLRVEGRVPEELAGTLYRNGPGLFSSFGYRYQHWFDGDGLVSAVRFGGGRALGAVRLLETAGLREERRRKKAYFGAYGTAPPGFFNPVRMIRAMRGDTKSPANTNLVSWSGRLLALCEIGKPFELHPEDLRSIGETDLGGVIPRAFSAHPHRVAASGCIYNIGLRFGRPNALDVFVLRPDGTAGSVATIPLDFPTMVHDFALTERALVVLVAPVRLALLPTLLGRRSFSENLRWEPERGTEVMVIPLDAPASPIRFHVDPFWTWHIGNAFDDGGEIVMDMVRYRDFPTTNDWITAMTHGGPFTDSDGLLGRARVDTKKKKLSFEAVRDKTGEFPRVAPSVDARENRVVYWTEHYDASVGRSGPPDTLVRVDMRTGARDEHRCPPGQFPSEAVLAPRSDREDDGWLVSLIYDSNTDESHFAVFDAARLADGPLARAYLGQHVPLSFHGAWVPASR